MYPQESLLRTQKKIAALGSQMLTSFFLYAANTSCTEREKNRSEKHNVIQYTLLSSHKTSYLKSIFD